MIIYVVGGGPGSNDFLTDYAQKVINSCDIVLTTDRLFYSLDITNANKKRIKITEIENFIMSECKHLDSVCIIASGDVGFYSIAKNIKNKFGDMFEVKLVSGISSLQYFTAKLGKAYDDVKIVSLHGCDKSIVPYVCYNKTVFCLTGSNKTAHDIVKELVEAGLGDVNVSIGEKLSSDSEKIVSASANGLLKDEFDNLSVMLIENINYTNPYTMLKDDDFIRSSVPMTKQCVRVVSIDMLNIQPTDIVYDIGAGTGSVSVCMAMRTTESTVYAIEKEEHAVDLIHKNIKKHKTYNIEVIEGTAPEALISLPAPDRVFIGGSKGNLAEIVRFCLEKNPKSIFVVNAVTIETLTQTVKVFKEEQIEYTIVCLNASSSHRLGNYNLMKAENPVYIIRGEKR